jgi:nucleoside-diphosphate-sugar epimerase
MKKKVLITGGSRGIGFAIAENLKTDHDVLTVGRSAGDYIGDLADSNFRKKIISSCDIDILINNAFL